MRGVKSVVNRETRSGNYEVGGETCLKEACVVSKQCLIFCLCEELDFLRRKLVQEAGRYNVLLQDVSWRCSGQY